MSNTSYFNLNNKFYSSDENVLSINNRSFRYGDGFFETMKFVDGKINIKHLHFQRIKKTASFLGFEFGKNFSFEELEKQIIKTAQKNNHNNLARIRVNFFRQDSELFNITSNQPNILIQSFLLQESTTEFNTNGLNIGVYSGAQKSCDTLSNLKTNSFLQYTLAANWAKENKLNDALVLNSNNSVADSTIANVFIIKNKIVYTPALNQACVDGVMRKYLINILNENKIELVEKSISIEEINNADELFLTNAIRSIQWVKQCNEKEFFNHQIIQLRKLLEDSFQ